MANLKANPWSIVPTDPATDTITSIVLNSDGTVTITGTSGLTFNTTAELPQWFTVIGVTNPAYIGFYKLIPGGGYNGGTVWQMMPQFTIPAGTASSSGGTLAQCLYKEPIRIEDISWQQVTAAGQILDFRDRNGNPIWQATAYAAGFQNRGKVYWVQGLTPIELDAGVALITVD
jgi:hypothetical protein